MSHSLHFSTSSLPLLPPHSHHSKQSPPLQFSQQAPTKNPTQPTIRTRLSQLCKSGRLDLARQLFDALPSPIPTVLWNTLLIGYVCNSMPQQALRLFSLFNHSNSSPDADADVKNGTFHDHYTYSSALKACADVAELRLGKSIHCHIIRRSPSPPKNPVLNNALLGMYASCLPLPHLDVVRLVFDRMPKRNTVSWNTLIAWHVKRHLPEDALRQFWRMIEMGTRPSPVSFINVFPAVIGVDGKEKYADLLYGMLVKYGNEYVNHVFVVSSAIYMYSELRDVRSARKVFDLSGEKNTEVWNTMIGGYVQNGFYEEAIKLFIAMLESNEVVIDSVSFLAALMAVSQLQNVALGQQIHALLVKENSRALSITLGNALVVMYSRCGRVQLAFDLFHQMPERDVVTWNTMISAFVQKDLNLEGLMLVYEMQKQGFAVDSVVVSALLSAASNLGNLRIGRETHGYLTRQEIHFEGMDSYLIYMYTKSARVEIARKLFDGSKSGERDLVTWNAMIAGYVHNGRTEEALSLFREMILKENQIPNSVTVSSILPACDPVGGIEAGKQIHGYAVRHCLDKNVFVGTALVDMYSRCGVVKSAEKVFDRMAERNTVTYTTMMSGFGQHGLGERALSLFQTMRESGLKPDAVAFVAVLSACSYSGLVDDGLALFESMKELGIVATSEHYCCVVDILGRAGKVEEAYEFVCSLGDDGNNVRIWGSLLSACRVHQKSELGKLVSERVIEMEKDNSDVAGYHVLLSNVYAAEGNWEYVDRIRKEMKERGLRKEPGWSSIEIGDTSHRFMSRDRHHSTSDYAYPSMEDLAMEMRSSSYEPIDMPLVHVDSELD